jgi:hypothetical protein
MERFIRKARPVPDGLWLVVQDFIHRLCNGTIILEFAVAVAAIDLIDLPGFQNHFHHPGTIQLAAVAAEKMLIHF